MLSAVQVVLGQHNDFLSFVIDVVGQSGSARFMSLISLHSALHLSPAVRFVPFAVPVRTTHPVVIETQLANDSWMQMS